MIIYGELPFSYIFIRQGEGKWYESQIGQTVVVYLAAMQEKDILKVTGYYSFMRVGQNRIQLGPPYDPEDIMIV